MRSTCVLLFCFSLCSSYAQGPAEDTIAVKEAIKQSIELYDRFTGAEANIYNGGEYVPYTFVKTGHPFFDSDSLVKGDITYAGRVYHSIPLQYDIARNQLVILNFDGLSKIVLHNNAVDSFHFLNYTFTQLKEGVKPIPDNTFFYELLFNGHIRVLARRKKLFEDTFKDDDIVRVFHSQDIFYIYKEDRYYAANNKKDVFSILKDKKHEIKNVMRQQKIKFTKKNFEAGLTTAARIYDQLIR